MILNEAQLIEEVEAFEKVKEEQGGFSHPQERTLETEHQEGAQILVSEGMTIHMEFAKAAMEAEISNETEFSVYTSKKDLIKHSILYADLMIKAYQDRGWL